MKRIEVNKSMRKYAGRAILFTLAVVLIANGANLLMHWIIFDLIKVANPYLASEYQFLGTLIIVNFILVVGFVIIYRRRKRELVTLSDNIEKVASGDFSANIKYKQKDSMAQVYSNFNKMSKELSSLQILREDFINNFSHEFKTPIASINGFAALLLEKELSKEEQRQYLTIIKEESLRLSNLTSDTILLSKLSSSDIVSQKTVYDLGEQIRQCSIILSNQWLAKKQIFSGDLDSLEFNGNYDLMQHLWINLLNNAIKYTPEGGEINVSLKRKEDMAIAVISDNGRGMDQNTLEHIFDPYYQGDGTRSNEGMGLGLPISKKIVDLCGGTITVESRVHEGSTFTVSLPLANE